MKLLKRKQNEFYNIYICFHYPSVFASCKKDDNLIKTSSSMNIINAAIDVPSLKINPTGKTISYASAMDVVLYGASGFDFAEIGLACYYSSFDRRCAFKS